MPYIIHLIPTSRCQFQFFTMFFLNEHIIYFEREKMYCHNTQCPKNCYSFHEWYFPNPDDLEEMTMYD